MTKDITVTKEPQEGTKRKYSIMTVSIGFNRSETAKKVEKFFKKTTQKKPKLCPVKDILHHISDKWSVLVMMKLGQHETLRFNELKQGIDGISQKMLTVTLRNLEQTGLVKRKIYAEVPPRVEYTITKRGHGFLRELMNMVEWALDNVNEICRDRFKHE